MRPRLPWPSPDHAPLDRLLWLAALLALALSLLAGKADAADRPLLLDAREYPWSAVGRINAAGRGFCTGVLVSRHSVLTAAHCLYYQRDGRWFAPEEIHFVAGYQRDRWLAHSRAADYSVAPGFRPTRETSLDAVLDDWAVVTLRKSLGERVGWIGVAAPDEALLRKLKKDQVRAAQVGYRRDRPHAQTVRTPCAVPGTYGNGRGLLHDCDVVEGASGSPLLIFRDGRPLVIGVHTVRAETDEGEAYAGVLSARVFHPQGGEPAAIEAGRKAGISWGEGRGPATGGEARALPSQTIDQLLQRLGYLSREDQASADSRASAIRSFEDRNGLPVTGRPSVALLGALVGALQ